MTWGGARFGNCAMGSVGIATAPARITSRAQTVAKMGRRMKKATTDARLALRRHGSAVHQELSAGDDHPVARLDALEDDVVAAHDLAHAERFLACHQGTFLLLGHEREVLSADAGDREHRYDRPLVNPPHDARPDE